MNDHWLVRPDNIRLLWRAFIGVLAVTVVIDLAVQHHGVFMVDGTPGFGAWFGFLSCMVLIFLAKLLSLALRRPDTYYD
jgi:hypothetical protein